MEKKSKIDLMGNICVNGLLTDFYQFSMIYAHWKNGKSDEHSVFNLFFRKCPFDLKFCVMGGVDESFEYLRDFKFTKEHIKYLKTQFPFAEEGFFEYLINIDMSDVNVYGFLNGDFILPNEPLLTIEGPLYKVQLLETTLLNLLNYPTLIATLSIKIRTLHGFNKITLIEDGSINSQSPCGGYIGVKYCSIGGVDKTSNLLAAKNLNLDMFIKTPIIDDNIKLEDLSIDEKYFIKNGTNIYELIISKVEVEDKTLLRRILYSSLVTFRSNVFSYNINSKERLEIEILNFCGCLFGLKHINEKHEFILNLDYMESIIDAQIVRNHLYQKLSLFGMKDLESINLKLFCKYSPNFLIEDFSQYVSYIDGIVLGSDFIVSSTQPALGMVYKINEIEDKPCIKFSEEKSKQSIPGFKHILRLFDDVGALSDFMCLKEELSTYLNSKEIIAYNYDEYYNHVKLKFTSCKIMNNLIFENGKILTDKIDVKAIRTKVLENYKFYINKNLKLYISNSIRNLIVQETQKLQEIKF